MQKLYRRQFAVAIPGQLQGLGMPRSRSMQNTAADTYETWDLSVPASAATNITFNILVDAASATVKTDSALNQAELEQALLAVIRQSEIYDNVVPTLNSVTHKIRLVCRHQSRPMTVTASGGGLSVTKIVPAMKSGPIPFGCVVGRQVGDPAGSVHLFSSLTDIPVGIVLLTHAIEKSGLVGQNLPTAYQPGDAVDVIDRVNSNDGIWVPCVEFSGITEEDLVFISIAPGTEGRVTKSSTGTAPFPYTSFRGEVEVDPNGRPIVLVSINKP